MQELSSLTKDQTPCPAVRAHGPNLWSARKFSMWLLRAESEQLGLSSHHHTPEGGGQEAPSLAALGREEPGRQTTALSPAPLLPTFPVPGPCSDTNTVTSPTALGRLIRLNWSGAEQRRKAQCCSLPLSPLLFGAFPAAFLLPRDIPGLYPSLCDPCFCSVIKSRPALRDPVDCSTPGFPVPHHFLEFAQIHVY